MLFLLKINLRFHDIKLFFYIVLVQADTTTWNSARANCRAKNAYTTIIGSTNEMADVAYFIKIFGGPYWVI